MNYEGRRFSHTAIFTGYMAIIYEFLKKELKKPSKILDIPAGCALLADELSKLGHEVVCADINEERLEFVHANMEHKLPFSDGEFDVVISMEGIEHVVNQTALLNEIVRITKPNGLICISTPNTSNFWSRLVFLFTGYFYQFNPVNFRVAKPDVLLDKGHISPISLYHLGYVMAVAGAGLLKATGDKYKKKVLLPLALLTYPFSYISAMRIKKKLSSDMIFDKSKPYPYFNLEIFLSRSLVAFFVRR
jgi:SAM-dependent methyltransferase